MRKISEKLIEIDKLQCCSSTSKEEILDFVYKHINKNCYFHYELNTEAFVDAVDEFILGKDGVKFIKDYLATEKAYVHSITITN